MRTPMLLALAVWCSAQVASGQPAPPVPSFPGTSPSPVMLAQPWPLPGSWYAPPAYGLPGPNGGLPAPPPGSTVVPLQVPPAQAQTPAWVEANLAEEAAARAPKHAETITSHPHWVWANFDYALGWIRPRGIGIPLLTTGSVADPIPGALGQPGTRILLGAGGADSFDLGTFNGIRPEIGFFLDDHHHLSIEATAVILFSRDRLYSMRSNNQGDPLLTRPINDVAVLLNGVERSVITAANIPLGSNIAGRFDATATSEYYGWEINARYNDLVFGRLQANVLTGFHALVLRERLLLQDTLQPLNDASLNFLGNPVAVGSTVTNRDHFSTSNRFYGWQIGIGLGLEDPWYFVRVSTKLGLGVTAQEGTIAGESTLISPAGIQTAAGGVLALSPNIGSHSRNVFGIVSDSGVQVGLHIHRNVTLQACYSFLLWGKVVRPEKLIDRTVNTNLLPTSATFGNAPDTQRPEPRFSDGAFWVHVLNLGVQVTY